MGLLVVVTLVTTGLLVVASAEPREQFVFRLLSVYVAGPDQATAADRDNNDQISDTEFLQSLFFFTDEKRDRRVTQAEFVDGYRRQFGLPSELLVIMFDLLDDLNDDGNTRQDSDVTDKRNNEYFDVFSKMAAGRGIFGKNHQNRGDGILTQRDVTVRKFVGESKQTNKEAYRKSLMKWVAAAADRLYSINYQPHIPGNPWDMEFDYERWFNSLDRNNDSLVSFKELSDEFRRYSPDGRVKRTRWVSRNVQTYRDREWLSTVMFDYWDKNKDLRLDDLDVGLILKEADRNRDTRVTTIEFHRFMEKYNKRARRRLATPVRPVMYDCPSPWWQSFGCRPRVDATRAAMDMDDNYDGWITQGELRKRVAYYDRNGDGYANRMEVMMLESMRYGVPGPVANVMFDVYDRNGDGRYDISDVQHMLSDGRVLCFCDARRAVMDLVKLADRFRQSPQTQGSAGSLRNAMRWQMKREWRWRRLAERLWHNVWGQGGSGGTCREGDCTGKDWRGGSWYSPFDWRQKNRVPENFLQWSYLHDIPRTISSPQGLGVGSGQFFPGSRSTWWNPQWPQGDNQYGGASPGSRSNPGGGILGGGMNFPSANPSRQFPPGSAMPMPPNFMPNPSKISSRPGNFPPTSNSGPFVSGNFPPAMDDNSAEEFWNRLLSGLDNETASDWDPIWMNANVNTLPKVFSKDQNLPQWTQTGTNKRNKPWNRKPDSPSFSEIFRNDGMKSNPNFQASDDKEQRDNSIIGLDRLGGSGRPGGQQRPTSSNSRFRREATETSDSKIPVSPVPLPPSPTTKPMSADVGNSSGVTGIAVNSTLSDSNDQLKDQNSTEANNTDQPVNQTTTESNSHDQSTSSDTDQVQGKLNTKDTAEKVGRSSAWLGVPFLASNGMSYDRGPDCDTTEPWVSNDMSDYNLDPRILDQTWQGQRDWSPLTEGLLNTNSRPAIMRDRFQTLPYNYNYRPQWWNLWNTYPSWPRQNGWNSNQMWRDFDGQTAFYPGNPSMYSPPIGQDFASPLGSQHNLYKRSTDSQNGKISQDDDEEVSRMMMPGNYERSNPTMWNKFNNYNNRFTYGYQSPWWNMWNGPSSWLQRNGWNSKNMWRNYGGQNSFFPRDWNFYSPSMSPNSGFPMGSQHALYKRSVDHDMENNAQNKEEQVSMMMNNRHYGPFDPSQLNRFNRYGYQPQWWNMRNNFNAWPQGDGWNSKQTWNNYGDPNFFFPGSSNFYGPSSFQGFEYPRNNQHNLYKRSADDQGRQNNERKDKVSRWMQNRPFGRFSTGPWNFNRFSIFNRNGPQSLWWNAYSSFPVTDRRNSNEFWRRYGHLNSFPQQNFRPYFQMNIDNYNGPTQVPHAIFRRSTENPSNEETHNLSRMMGGYGDYWPQWWNNYRYWPGYWNNWNWMWSRYYPFYFSKDNKQPVDKEHILTKRSTDLPDDDKVSRMMGGYGGYWPQWWNMWNSYSYRPGYWNNNMRWNNNNQWNNYNHWSNNWQLRNNQFYPFYSSTDNSANQPVRMKRSTDSADTGAEDQVSRMMGGYGGYWPQWWNMWNSYRYWPGYWNNWNWMWSRYYPSYFSKENKEQSDKEHVLTKRSSEGTEDQVSRMMGGYGGYWPQWWNMWNNYRYWPGYWNNNMRWNNNNQWNNYNQWNNNWQWRNNNQFYPSYFSIDNAANTPVRMKRSTDDADTGAQDVSRMMGGYGGYWPQWWNMWNNYRYWPGYWNNNMRWNNNNQWNNYNHWSNNWQLMNNHQFYPFYSSTDNSANQPVRMKRSTDSADTGAEDQVSRMMGGYGGYWPQWWNMWNNYRHWPGNWNWMWNGHYPFFFSKENKESPEKQHVVSKRSTDQLERDQVSRMMGGYGSYWPPWWNMGNNYRYWPGYWNNWNWMWSRYYPFYFSKENTEQSDKEHVLTKRSTEGAEDQVSRMMGGYGGYLPQWWNMWNNYRYWPGYWNNNMRWNNNNQWNNYNQWNNNWQWRNNNQFYPSYFSIDNAGNTPVRMKRSTGSVDTGAQDVSRMMGGYGGYWPQWWNMWNYRYWPGYWNNMRLNNNNQWNNYNHWRNNWQLRNNHQFYPFYSSTDNSANQPVRMKRSTDSADTGAEDQVSRMMGGYGNYWPHWWNMWNNYRYWPGYWNNWNWMWSRYYPFSFSKEVKEQSDKEHVLTKRSTEGAEDQVSRMMGGYGGYWPQWWNMWNNYRYWPGHWNNNMRWNNNNQWNNYNQWNNNWQWRHNNQFYPSYFSIDTAAIKPVRMKRSTDDADTGGEVSRMMGGYGSYWPQWWNMWNNYRYWPGHWNSNMRWNNNNQWNNYNQWNNNWQWRNNNQFYPTYFSIDNAANTPVRMKRSTDDADTGAQDVSRMMGGYGSYWPQWWNMWNNYRYRPGYWNNNMRGSINNQWKNYNQWSSNSQWGNNNQFYPFYFSTDNSADQQVRMKRSTDDGDNSGEDVSRMMSGYGGYWPQWWNMWNSYRYWPGHWNNWNWMWSRNYYPFYFSKENKEQSDREHILTKRSSERADDKVSRMMGGYWPQWWNMWNSYRYWPGYWNNWNWMWNRYYPFFFSKEDKESPNKEHVVSKRSTDQSGEDNVSRMMDRYSGFWPQQQNMWNSYRYWPSYRNNWNNNWMWNRYSNSNHLYPFFSQQQHLMNYPHRMKREAVDEDIHDVSRMMGGYGSYWPQWWNMWNNYRYWPGYWNNWNWMWNRYFPFYFSTENGGSSEKQHVVSKRSTDQSEENQVSRMMDGYGGYWPQWWNMWNNNRYWPGYWNNNWRWSNNNQWNNYNRQWRNNNQFYPYDFYVDNSANQPARMKRSTDDADPSGEHVSRMMGGYGGYWPQWWNMWNSYRYWPGYWNWMWNSYYPFYFSKEDKQQPDKEHVMAKRSTDQSKDDQVSKMMGGYWPRWWNMWNNYRYWPGYWNNWNWMWSRYYPFYFSKDNKQPADKEHILTKRSTDMPDDDQVSRMMGGYGGYWPQWWNMWNNYRYRPGYWNNNMRWNNNNQWNNYNHWRNNWQLMNNHQLYPFYSSTDNSANQPVRMKRSTDSADTGAEDQVSRMMGGYGGYWPQWWNMWNNYRHWPGNWNWMWNGHYPFFFSKENKESSDKQHVISKRSTDQLEGYQVSRMMGGYGSYWPQWWNSYRYWPGYWNNNWRWDINNQWNSYKQQWRNNNQLYPFYFSTDIAAIKPVRMKRSTDDADTGGEVSRMRGGYGSYWPQWWNMWNNYRYWPGYWNNWGNNWMWNSYARLYHYYPFSFSKQENQINHPSRMKREADDDDIQDVSRMMGGYGGYWPQWWNMWNNYRYHPGHWNNWNWMWNNHWWNSHFFAKQEPQMDSSGARVHIITERDTGSRKHDQMMHDHWGLGCNWNEDHTLGQGTMWNSPRQWPQWMWNFFNQVFPYYSEEEQQSLDDKEVITSKQSTDTKNEHLSKLTGEDHVIRKRSTGTPDTQKMSRMMGGYGSYWPQWWNMWNNYKYWPGYRNNWNWMWNRYYPFHFSKENKEQSNMEHILSRRSTDMPDDHQPSRMMGGYGGNMPQWWNMWNNYRYWPGYQNNWNWMWNNYNPFFYSEENTEHADKEHVLTKRSSEGAEDQVSRMMGGYGGYWPQWWSMWNNYRYWPGYWNNNWQWMWNNNRYLNNYRPFYFSSEQNHGGPNMRMKRSTTENTEDKDISRMMGGYGGYWPQWWNMWNNYRYWPGYWNNWNWMWNRNYPYYFSHSQEHPEKEHILSKRSPDNPGEDKVSNMMGGYGGYWPQWWNMWNSYRYWPGYWNNWNSMRNNYYPFYFSKQKNKHSDKEHYLSKRSIDQLEGDQVSRMMGGYGGYWPQWWNMWNSYRHWPGYWNNWNWMWSRYYPFYFSKENTEQSDKEHVLTKRSSEGAEDQVSRMMGGYGGYWPQWWNMRNNYRYWPGYWMWNSNSYFRYYYPFYFSGDQNYGRTRMKRSTIDNTKTEDISRMMGGYGGYRPQWWNMWNNYRYWPGYWSNWNSNRDSNSNWGWMHSGNGLPFSSYHHFQSSEYSNGHHNIFKRDASGNKKEEKLAHMMNGYHHPFWHKLQNMWNDDRYRSDYWNNQPSWSNDWNKNRWPWNTRSGQVPPSSFFYQQIGNPDFPPTNSYPQQIWNSDNRLNEFPSFRPFGFSHNGKEPFDDLAENHREKRSSESGPSENKTAENSTDTSSANDTESAAEPDIARQMTGYDGSPGNPYQRQWWRLYRSYLDSRPRYWRSSPYFIAYDDPYDSFYRRRYSNRYGRYYFVRYVLPWKVYQYWLWQMWNRMWAQNQNLNQNEYDALWRDFSSRYAPFSNSWGDSVSPSEEDVRQKRNNDVVSEKEGENEAQEETANRAEKRTKRTTGGMNYLNRYPYQDRTMFDQWWSNNMYSYNNWPGRNYGVYNRMRGPWNGNNNWMWSKYNHYPFMYSQPSESSSEDTRQENDDGASAINQNTATATPESSRSKRSTGQQNKDDDIKNEDISRWMRIPDQFYNQPMWQQSSWGKQMPRWMGGNSRGFNNFPPGFTNGNDWNSRFMPINEFNQHFNQDRTWDRFNSFSPFSFTESDKETDKQLSRERQKRSAEEALEQNPTTDGAEPKVSRSMRGFPSMPVMSVMVYPWPLGMRQAWQYQGYNSQSQWRAWNRWGEGRSWDKWNSAYTATFPSIPFALSSSADNTKNENIRQKRSSESSPDLQKGDSEEAPENEPEVSRMGRVFGLTRFYPVGWKNYSPSILKNDQWMRYNWPMFNSYFQTPWGSDWAEKNQFPSGLLWSQKQFYPQWNQYQNMPFWGWNGKGQNVKNRMNPFNNDHVDESVFDPLSSYYFSQKDAENTNIDEKLENSISDKTLTEDSKTAISQEEKGRSRRSVLTLGKLLSKGQEQPEERKITFQTMLKPNRRFIKRHVQYKVKRFSQEATARLEKRFKKRSPTSTPDPTPTTDKSTTSPEVAPKMAMRATAPAQGDSMRDREWGPPRGTGFAPNPVSSPRLPDRNEIPNPSLNPNWGTGQTPGSGRGVDPLGNYGSLEDWNWDQPGWGSNPNWAGGRDRGSQGGGQDIRDKNQDPKGPQDRDNTVTTTTTTTGSQPTSDNPSDSILNGDPQNRLSNYNYIDFNNPNYWNQFYNPSSFNSSAVGSLGNASQWENWFGLWAYGPNFWDDMNDLDLWDAPWGSGSWGMGPGGDQWNRKWWGNPSTGFSSALPVEIGWEIFWLGDCDEDWNSRDSGYRSLDTQEWLTPVRLVDVAYRDAFPGYTLDRDCKDCFRPYALFPRRYRNSFRPTRFYFRPSLSRFRPIRYSYRPPRFFRPSARPRGSSGGPWYKRFPGYPWDSYGKAQWRGLPGWGWDPNSFWNPWRYRIQYHNNLDNKVRRSRRAAPPSSGLTNLGATSTTVHKLAPTAATIHTIPGSPGNTPSLPSPFNNQGPVGSKPFPGKLGPPFNPSLVGPYNRNDGGAGWGFGSHPASGRGSSWVGNGLPWWDKNNWHVASAEHGIGRFPDRSNPQDTFNRFPGSRNFPGTLDGASNVPAGLDGPRNFPAGLDGPRNFPAGLEGPRNFPAGLDGPRNFPAGLEGPRNFPAGLEEPRNFPAGLEGPRNFPAGLEGPRNFPAGLEGPRNFPAGLEGPRNFPAGLEGPRNFPAGLEGPRNFPAGLEGPRNFPAGLEGPRNFPARLDEPTTFPGGLGQGRDWRPPLFPQDTRPATPWRGGEFFRAPGAGFYPGPLRQEGGESAGDIEADRSTGSEPVTPQTPWNPSPWNTRKFDGNDQSSGNKDGNSGLA